MKNRIWYIVQDGKLTEFRESDGWLCYVYDIGRVTMSQQKTNTHWSFFGSFNLREVRLP